MEGKKKKDQNEENEDEKWALKYLDTNDEANKPDVVLRDFDFNANRFAIWSKNHTVWRWAEVKLQIFKQANLIYRHSSIHTFQTYKYTT